MRRPAGRVTRTRSPGRSSRAGFALWSFTSTLPPVQAAAASARLLNRRAAQSHLSARTESAGLAHISAGRRPTPHGPETASAESARANRAPDRYPTLIEPISFTLPDRPRAAADLMSRAAGAIRPATFAGAAALTRALGYTARR